MARFCISLPAGGMIAAIFVGQALGMAGIVSFPALLPRFQDLWSLTNGEAGLISGIYFAGYIVTVPVLSSLTDRLDPRRIYVASLLFGAAAALGFALLANGAASASLWRFLQGAAFSGAHSRERGRSRMRFRRTGRPARLQSTPQPLQSG